MDTTYYWFVLSAYSTWIEELILEESHGHAWEDRLVLNDALLNPEV